MNNFLSVDELDRYDKCVSNLTPEQWLAKFLPSNSNTISLGLDNVRQASNELNLAKPAAYVITVAGTNGKGSVVKLLEKLLVKLGLTVGCYTSPHLIKFNERICINGSHLSDEEIITWFNHVKAQLEHRAINKEFIITYFEFITLAAWSFFASKQLDVVILEIGLGGRLDAVNIIPKDLAIITSIDYDHQNLLGDNLELIGYEKSGIMANNKPVILGDSNMPESVFRTARECNSVIYQYGVDYNLIELQNNKAIFSINSDNFNNLELDRNTNNNIKLNNIATSLMALSIYRKQVDSYIVRETVNNFNLIGRCTWLDTNKTILVDVAHNLQAVSNLRNFLVNNIKIKQNVKISAVFGMLIDKDIYECLKIMNEVIDDWYITDIKESRGASAALLAKHLLSINSGANYNSYSDVITCYKAANRILRQKINNDIILVVFGSFHLVGPVCDYYYNNN